MRARHADAAMLVIATQDAVSGRQIADAARALNPGLEIVLRTHSDGDSQLLRKEGIATVFFGEEELAKGMTAHILDRFRS